MFILSKTIFRFSEIPIKIPIAFFHRNKTNNPKICIEPQKTPKQPKESWEKGKGEGYQKSI